VAYVVKCISYGFELYRGPEPKTVEAVMKIWGGYCPKRPLPLGKRPIEIAVKLLARAGGREVAGPG
jgi:hypothetical protein